MSKKYKQAWDLDRAREFYNIPVWGEGYFDINSLGHVIVRLGNQMQIDLYEVAARLTQQGVSLPVLVRFPQILQARVKQLAHAFELAAEKSQYAIEHLPFYPLKVNQQGTVVEHILSADVQAIGLEVGTKAELLAALGVFDGESGRLICNGYKDRAYIRLALFAQAMNIQTFLVVEKLAELELIIEEAERLNIEAILGVRIRLHSIAAGKWQNSGGKEAKFGLSTAELVNFIAVLEQQSYQAHLKVLHFHMGSQISNVSDFRLGLLEAMSVYRALHEEGIKIEKIDIGGGVGVDYSSQQNISYFSKSYSLQDYADTVVVTIGDYCLRHDLPLPQVLSENGRALSAHHAVLLTNVVEAEQLPAPTSPAGVLEETLNLRAVAARLLQDINLTGAEQTLSIQDYDQFLQRVGESFVSGEISLLERAKIETHMRACLPTEHHIQKYYLNFSLFQSLPDAWGLGQIFPIMPIQKLHEEPHQQVVLHDLTCDSDGHIDSYACDGKVSSSIRMHAIEDTQQYLLGFFLLGAYQEVLGDMHNLFGDTHALNVELTDNQELVFTDFEGGDTVQELLAMVHIDSARVMHRCQQRMQAAKNTDVQQRLAEINNALYSYSYLDSMDRPAHRIKDE